MGSRFWVPVSASSEGFHLLVFNGDMFLREIITSWYFGLYRCFKFPCLSAVAVLPFFDGAMFSTNEYFCFHVIHS